MGRSIWKGVNYSVLMQKGTHLYQYSKTCLKQPLSKRPKIGFQDQLSLNAGQKYCRMQHSAILSTFIKLPFVIKIFVFSIFKWLLKKGLLYINTPISDFFYSTLKELGFKTNYHLVQVKSIAECSKGSILQNF